MFAELHYPINSLKDSTLDEYLERGWFRMGQTIFTTNFLKFSGLLFSVIWLRIDLLNFKPSKTQQKLQKLNASFTVEIKPSLALTPEHLILFNKYKNHVPFDAAPSLTHLLYDDKFSNVFDSYEVNIYDNRKLIACGIFDLGNDASTGITCFYDPDYQKHSLGKYLMFLKMDFSKNQGMSYFYPGYFAPNYPIFDYKLNLAKPYLEFLELATNQWKSFQEYVYEEIPLVEMTQKLKELSASLTKRKFVHSLLKYEYFDADLSATMNGRGTFDFPIFILCFERDNSVSNPLIIYDVISRQYHLVVCDVVYQLNCETIIPDCYNENLLQITQHLFATESAEAMALVISRSLQKTFGVVNSQG
jgi:leucyl-tRNA---protein transferase